MMFILFPCLIVLASIFAMQYALKKKRARFLADYRFPLYLLQTLQRKHTTLSLEEARSVAEALRQFFQIYVMSGKSYVGMPSQIVDDLWHEFILDTRAYAKFCRKAFGGFLHHAPASSLGAVKNNNVGLRRSWWHACHIESINPKQPSHLPLLFALDALYQVPNGFYYTANCGGKKQRHADGTAIHCGTDFSSFRYDRSTKGLGCGGLAGCGGAAHTDAEGAEISSCGASCGGCGGCGGG